MNPEYLIHVWPLFLAGAVSLLFGALALRRRGAPGATPFFFLMLGLAVWAIPDALFQISEVPRWQHFWTKVEYIGIALVPVFWVLTALAYTGRGSLLEPGKVALAFAVPVITILLTFTFESHNLIYEEYLFFRDEGRLHLDITYGAWWWINAAYAYLLLIWGAGLFLMAASRSFYVYRSQAVALLTGISLPIVGNVLHIFRIGPFGAIDPTPFTFVLAGVPLGWAIFRFRLFDLSPVAREAVFEGMEDGVIVLDRNNRISDLNPAAEAILGRKAKRVVGLSVTEAVGVWLGRPGEKLPLERERRDLHLLSDGEERVYEMDVSPLKHGAGGAVGRVLILKDVTRWRTLDEELISAREEVRQLAELLPMCGWCRQVRTDEGYWEGLESYITKQARTQFTHGICPTCKAKLARDTETSGPESPPRGGDRPTPDESGGKPRGEDPDSERWPGPRDPGLDGY